MAGISFEMDGIAFLLAVFAAVCFAYLYRWSWRFLKPRLFFSDVQDLKVPNPGWRVYMSQWPEKASLVALGFFLLAFSDPRFYAVRPDTGQEKIPTEGIAIYLLLDQSGSMEEHVTATLPGGQTKFITKIDLLKIVTKDFIAGDPKIGLEGRFNDLIGLIFFARTAQIIVPLTLDHREVLKKLETFQVVQSNEQEGTGIGYAIFKTANLIDATRHYTQDLPAGERPAYDIKNSIIMVVTDGLQEPSPLDAGNRLRTMGLEEAAEYAKEKGVKVYIVNVDPSITSDEFAPQRRLMQRITSLTGGKFYMIDNKTSLDQIYKDIDSLEKSRIPGQNNVSALKQNLSKDKQPNLYRRISLYPYSIGIAMLLLTFSWVFETLVLRKIP